MISLDENLWKVRKWADHSIYVCGWGEYKGRIVFALEIIDIIYSEHLYSSNKINDFAGALNGNFSIIICCKEKTYLLADRMRSYPLVYFFHEDALVITDNLIEYQRTSNTKFQIDEIICEQFLSSNFVVGPYTLFKEVFSIQSGESVKINHGSKSIKRIQYFQWTPYMENDEFKRNYKDEAKQQEKIFLNVFNRMIKSAPDVKNWIIPLSGGYDSRVIINYLYKLGIKNAICFTYGMENNIQSEISRKVAEALGYEWHFIDYKKWIKEMKGQNIIDGYLEYGFNGSSVPHLQDFTAVYALKEMEVINKNDIFVPGHALEVIAGSHLKLEMQNCINIDSAIPIIKSHLSGFAYYTKNREIMLNHVKSVLMNYNIEPTQLAECFDWQERQTKFIANSVKVYEYFGFDWRIPQWDSELIEYWSRIGFNYKYDRNMFKDVFKEYLVVDVLKSIPFANDLQVKKKQNLKSLVLNKLPLTIKKTIKRINYKTSFYFVNEGTHLLYSDKNETISEYLKSFNSPYIVWKYLKAYPQKQKLSNFEVNSVSTLINLRKSINLLEEGQ